MHNISTLKVPTPTIFFVSSANFYQPSKSLSDMKATLKTLKEHAVVFWNWRKSRRPAQSKAEALVILHRLLLCPWSSQSVPSISPLCCYLCSKGQLLHLKIFFSFFFFLFSFFLFHFFFFFSALFSFSFFPSSFFFFFLFGNLMFLTDFSFNTPWVHWKWLRETGGFSDQQMYVTLSEINEWEKWDVLSWSGQCN